MGLSLLDAAQQAGVRLPRSCRNGSCRACLAQVLQGQVHHRIDWPGLSRDEQAEGWVLPCVAVSAGDVVLLAPQARQADVMRLSVPPAGPVPT